MTSRDIISLNTASQPDQNPEAIDFGKLFFIVRKSLIWVVLIFMLGLSIAYLIVRYTKPVYESHSIIKLNFENEANTLGLVSNPSMEQGLNDISGEIELLKSKVFLSRAVKEINYPVSYFIYGTYLTDERYRNAPFNVSFKLKNQQILDRPFDVVVNNEESFQLSYGDDGNKVINEYRFGEQIDNEHFTFLIEKTNFFGRELYGRYYFMINSEDALISYLQQNLSVVPENFSAQTIRISLTDYNKYKAQDFVNTINDLYLQTSKDKKTQTIIQKIDFLDEQISSTEEKIGDFDTYFENFTIENKTISLQNDLSRTIGYLNSLDSQRFNLREHISNIGLIRDQLSDKENVDLNPFLIRTLPSFISTAIQTHRDLLDERELKLTSYNENTSVIQRLDDQLVNTRADVIELIEQYDTSLRDNLNDINKRIGSLERNFTQLPSMGTEYNKNRSIYQQLEEQLLLLRKSKMELEITRAGTVTDFELLSPASLPSTPIKPQKFLILGAGVIASLILSLIFIAVRYLVHNKITSVRELEKLSPVPIIGSIPFYRKEKLSHTRMVVDLNSKSALGESLRSIRTNMEFIKPKEETHLITITSTISSEGKTFVAVNLGAIISSTRQKVCIVDLDMRKPKVHLAFQDDESPDGVSTILIGKTTIQDCLRETPIKNMYYIGAGPTPPNPSELILTEDFDNMLEKLKKQFDIVILDTPPVGLVTDGVLAMDKSDLILYVVKADYSRRSYLKSVHDIQRINRFRNMALLLNGVRRGTTYGYGYYSDHGYYAEEVPQKGLLSMIRSLF